MEKDTLLHEIEEEIENLLELRACVKINATLTGFLWLNDVIPISLKVIFMQVYLS